jgi:hypothetical protein
MAEITLNFDKEALHSIDDLMKFYQVSNKADLITKAITVLKICAHVDRTNGELVARKNGQESIILTR